MLPTLAIISVILVEFIGNGSCEFSYARNRDLNSDLRALSHNALFSPEFMIPEYLRPVVKNAQNDLRYPLDWMFVGVENEDCIGHNLEWFQYANFSAPIDEVNVWAWHSKLLSCKVLG